MRHYLGLLLFVGALIGGAALLQRVKHATPKVAPAKTQPVAPAKPQPAAKIKLLLFTQPGCTPCARMKRALHDPALKDVMQRFDLEEVKPPDKRFRQYKVTATPDLIALTTAGPKRLPDGQHTLGQLAAWLGSVEEIGVVVGHIVAGNEVGANGVAIVTDLPRELRMHNTGGNDNPLGLNPRHEPGKGSGLCVFTSIEHSARWQNERKLWGLQKKMMHEPGGGWPQKVDAMIKKYGPGTAYLQYEGRDPSILELALKTGRMPAVTYNGHDGVFYRGYIAHMVNLVYLSATDAAILDNNNPDKILWMSRQEFLDRWCGNGNGWCVVLLSPRPPPAPKN